MCIRDRQYVGAIHGRLLTAWSAAGIFGPSIVNYTHDTLKGAGVAPAHLYDTTMYILAGLLVAGLIANLLIRPVNSKWHMSDDDLATARALAAQNKAVTTGSFGIGRGGIDAVSLLAWAVALVPIAWGVWIVAAKLPVLFK